MLDHGALLALTDGVDQPLLRGVLGLAALALARALATALLDTLRRAPGRAGRLAIRLGRALRPGVVRRATAVVLGIGVPMSVLLPPAPASARTVEPASIDRGPATQDPATASDRKAAQPAVVVVAPGDTLWDIARRHLPSGATPADIARAWPRWYAENRAAIGPDPDLIRPGTRLRVPDRRPTGTSASSHDRPAATTADPGAVADPLDPDRR